MFFFGVLGVVDHDGFVVVEDSLCFLERHPVVALVRDILGRVPFEPK
jgi:hypothetical protein